MAGYNWKEGKSNNYVTAENNGLLKASEATKYLKKHYGIVISVKQLQSACRYDEWHHASKFFNKVYFYSESTLDAFGAKYQGENFKQANEPEERVVAIFEEWESYQKNRFGKQGWRKIEVEYSGVKKGDWLHLDEGGKKNLRGKGFVRFK